MDEKIENKNRLPRQIWWGVAGLAVLFVVSFTAVRFYSFSQNLKNAASQSLENLQSAAADLQNLETGSAAEKFRAVQNDLNFSFGDFFSGIKVLFGSGIGALGNLETISSQGVAIAEEVQLLQSNAIDLMTQGHGDQVIASLKKIKTALDTVASVGDSLSSNVGRLQGSASDFGSVYLPLKLNMESARRILDTGINWLDTPNERHLIVFFSNPSEMRPGGGFLGSFGEITLKEGSIESIKIHDINDADRLQGNKTIPPKPLQALVTNWRAADANWFFNFPDSAERVLQFLEASKLYAASSTTFDGAIAITPNVLKDMLDATGPVTVAGIKTPLDKNNFLIELQREVQLGQSQNATYPKKALEAFGEAVIANIRALDTDHKQTLLKALMARFQSRDVELYVRDKNLEGIVQNYNLGGAVSNLSQDTPSDYLAVVDANIGGGKSDLYIKQNVSFESRLETDGMVSDHLTIIRNHEGNKSSYWWYNIMNQDYLQLFVPENANLMNMEGGSDKKIFQPINYAAKGYTKDDLISQIEASAQKLFGIKNVTSHAESGKKVFATWVKTAAGATSQLTFDYTHRLSLAPTDGMKYQFILDGQPGAQRHYLFQIDAPAGFNFKENSLQIYRTEADDPIGTLKIDLTLEKL